MFNAASIIDFIPTRAAKIMMRSNSNQYVLRLRRLADNEKLAQYCAYPIDGPNGVFIREPADDLGRVANALTQPPLTYTLTCIAKVWILEFLNSIGSQIEHREQNDKHVIILSG